MIGSMSYKKFGFRLCITVILIFTSYYMYAEHISYRLMDDGNTSYTTHEVGFDDMPEQLISEIDYPFGSGGWYTLSELRNYQRPERERPLVGIQIGHWQHQDAPEELAGLRGNTGAVWGEYTELAIMFKLGKEVATRLKTKGVDVDVLPVTIPPGYEADVFITLHADGNSNPSVRGFKISGPRIDYSGQAETLVEKLRDFYRVGTNLPEDPQITRRMSAYYAFNWARYEHAVHPYTPVAIIETGFISNNEDRNFLLEETELVASSIVDGVLAFLKTDRTLILPQNRLEAPDVPLTGTVECAPLRIERIGSREAGCELSIKSDTGNFYLLITDEVIATSTLPYRAQVTGDYLPAQTLSNYFWFPFEVRGIFNQATIVSL